jgi:NAD+ synthase
MENHLLINPKSEKEKIINFLKKTLEEQKIDKIVLGLSGGVDSTTILYLLKEFLAEKNIYVVQIDYYLQKKVLLPIKSVNFIFSPIKKMVDLTAEKLEIKDPVRFGNIMARTRMMVLFDFAKKLNALVCGTENKSERLLGYFTRFGDSASDIEPISHLYKTQIYQLAKYLQVPKEIINQSPSAGLWDGQTDEGEFGFSYLEADQVLHLYYDEKITLKEILKQGFKNAEKIIKRSFDNQFKLKTPYTL